MPEPQPDLIACPHCDALYRRRPLGRGEKARCARCGTPLYRERPRIAPQQLLALVIAALVTFVIANAMPIVDLNAGGVANTTTLIGSILLLWQDQRHFVALLAMATTIAFPLLELGALLGALLLLRRDPGAPLVAVLLRGIQAVRPWGMIEVFMLGVIVTLIKVSKTVHVVPGVALWAFAALTIMLALIVSFDLRVLWSDRPVETGR